ncbi:MAG: hypothetical protein CMH64_03010 [Nanoarchaeota archaeon]|jgi:hypothetical protein|nr:hypothetical protein [Nanoarchaeota archaeon]
MKGRHTRRVTRRHIESGNYIDRITISKAVEILEPHYSFDTALQSERRTLIRSNLKNNKTMYSKIYSYQLI